jgi:hypothetical protein
MRASRLTALAASGICATGLLAGHWLAYAALHPSAPARHAALASAHGWMSAAQELAPLVSVVAAVAIVLQRLGIRSGAWVGLTRSVRQLAAMQIAAFTCLELAERLSAGGWADLPAILLVGAAAQALTAWLAALAIDRLSSLGSRLREAFAAAPRIGAPDTGAHVVLAAAATSRAAGGPFASRAPPLTS